MGPNDNQAPAGSSDSVFEFSGDAAGSAADGPVFDANEGSASFVAGDLDLSDAPAGHESNLGGGGGKWIALVAILLLVAQYVLRFEDFLLGSFDGSLWRFLRSRFPSSSSSGP